MEPFTVICATCDSRIRVRNPNLVGQLATCPKCSSMIMIAPSESEPQQANGNSPPGQVQVSGRRALPVDSTAVTKEGLVVNMGGAIDSPSFPQAARASSPSDTDNEYRLADFDHESGALAPPPVQQQLSPTQAWQPHTAPHVPTSQWTSESTNRTRQYLLIGFLGISGIALAALLFTGFLRWYAAESPKDTLAGEQSTESVQADSKDIVGTGPEEPSQNPPYDSHNDSDNNSASVPSPAAADPSLYTLDPALALDPAPSRPSATVVPAVVPPLEPVVTNDSPANNSEPTVPVASDSALQLPKQLAAFAPMLSVEIQPQLPDAIEILSEAPVTAEDLGLTSSAGLPEIPAVDLTKQAQTPISALIIPKLPISQFISLWSNLSGVPTVADLDSLDAAAIDRNQKMQLELVQATTAGSIMSQLGQTLGLQAVPQENRFLQLRAPTELIEQKLPSTISLSGLLVDEAGEKWLTQALNELLPDWSASWTIADNQLQRPVLSDGSPMDPLLWFSAIKLIEGWRQATGQPSTLSGYSPSQLSSAFINPTDVTALEKQLAQITPQSRPVSQVLPRVCQEAGLHIWIDWANLGAIGLGPQTTAVFVTSARPLRRVLADYANEFSFVVAVLDSQSLIVTTNQVYRSTPQLYVIPSGGRTVEEWKSQLRPNTPAASGGVGAGAVVVIPTPDEKFVLVRCCRPSVSF